MSDARSALYDSKGPESNIREQKPSVFERLRNKFPFLLGTKKGITIIVAVVLVVVGGGLAGLAALPKGSSGNFGGDGEQVKSDTYFYGQSPAVYPSPEIDGFGDDSWGSSVKRARLMVNNMTLEEKVSLTGGVKSDNGCAGNLPAVKSVGFPGMCLHDAGQGVRNADFVSAFSAGVHVGASWNKNLTLRRAWEMGSEFKTKGVNVLLGPSIGPMGRVVRGGRNWESFSVDPYLTGALVNQTVHGAQRAGVITSTKHFIANEQETHRMQKLPREAVSSNIDDRTMHEFYLWPFADAVKAGTGNIMCSYQRVNNSYGCQNSKAMNGLLKTELGFQGWVVSDWDAQHAGVATAEAGMDVAMPAPQDFWGDHLVEAVENGTVPESRITDMAVRLIASWYQMGQDEDFPKPGVGMPKDLRQPHPIIDARNSTDRGVLMDSAIEGHVLVKNINDSLPLEKPQLLSVFGYSARSPDYINFDGGGFSDPMQFGAMPVTAEEVQAGFEMNEEWGEWSGIAFNGALVSGGGSGATVPSLSISPLDALKARADRDNTLMLWDFTTGKPGVHPGSDVCLVMGNAWASESYDRPSLHDDYTDGLILHVAEHCENTMVVLHNAGPRLVDQWIEHPNVTAVIFAHLPGQESGKALVSILYGEANPSGKLPYTIARNETDYGGVQDPDEAEGMLQNYPQSNFTEGVFVDYRHFDKEDIEPRFEFGFGLSYTTFEFGNITVDSFNSSTTGSDNDSESSGRNVSTAEFPEGPIREGGAVDLWDVLVRVEVDVTNTGDVDGAEVAQLYVGLPDEAGDVPVQQLRGFEKPFLEAGGTERVRFELTRRDLSVWDVEAQKWRLQRGPYRLLVGSSSRNIFLKESFDIQD